VVLVAVVVQSLVLFLSLLVDKAHRVKAMLAVLAKQAVDKPIKVAVGVAQELLDYLLASQQIE
jgi:hypothetical protein